MGYKLEKHDPYVITGRTGKEYEIPPTIEMSLEDIEMMLRYNKSTDEIEKAKICKEFFLHAAPDLEKEGISDMEYFVIFQDYNNTSLIKQKGNLGES